MGQIGQFIINHWGLWLALLVILALILGNELLARRHKAQELTPSMAIDKINHENAVVIDLRDAESFRAGHIINAVSLSANDLTSQRMDKYKSKPIILVCARGLQSPGLAARLRAEGFANPMVLSGGMAAWTAANLPVVKGRA
ncbi:rhodanese-like domain-containing protein [Legionella londiniensis]|uniref:Rhodanese domain-containing protein n=1 Tax=Legionella londiniensis TaxID=45068 RepID=A0A0W0VS41_9GAMM|nr:rhodanese-like domain-containing protein [Legionella londiniensis]KTD22967.1 rhodanese domain-containing protein [Legionella londiniensis]STX92925.1 Rhodanese sulfurtransferase like protein [Legionella londiniensis]